MNIIQIILNSVKKHFEENGKLEKFSPLFDATKTFFFIPGDVTTQCPHVRDSLDLKRFMSFVVIAVFPTFLWGIYNTGYHTLLATGQEISFLKAFVTGSFTVIPIVFVSYAVGFFWEVVFAVVKKHNISEGFLVTGILFSLTLPPSIPLWQVALGISFGVVVGKEVFGGTGRNFLNPALTGRAFLFFSYPLSMSGDNIWIVAQNMGNTTVDAISAATPLVVILSDVGTGSIEAVLNDAGYFFTTLFYGLYPGSIGETSTLFCLAGALILVVTRIANYRIIAGGVIGVLATGFFLNFAFSLENSPWYGLNPFYHLVMGGFAFGITFMATDPVSAPGMDLSRWIYGFLTGILVVVIRVFNPAYPEGVMLSILFMNMLAPLIDHFIIEIKIKNRIANV